MKQVESLHPDHVAGYDHSRLHPRTSTGSTISALWTLFCLTIRHYIQGKRWMVMGLLFMLPAALAILLRITEPNDPLSHVEFFLVFNFIPYALLPLIAQLLATIATTVVLTGLFTSVTYVATYAGGNNQGVENITGRALTAFWILGLSVTTYCCFFACISLFTRRTLIIGICYTLIFEIGLVNIAFGTRWVTVAYYMRVLTAKQLEFVDNINPNGPRNSALIDNRWELDLAKFPKMEDHPQFNTCILVLVISSLAVSIFAALAFSMREFRVKTPEGN
jgi:ABC-2 type transport system permease protein